MPPMEDFVAEGEPVDKGKLQISTREDLIWTEEPRSVEISNRLDALNSHQLLARAIGATKIPTWWRRLLVEAMRCAGLEWKLWWSKETEQRNFLFEAPEF